MSDDLDLSLLSKDSYFEENAFQAEVLPCSLLYSRCTLHFSERKIRKYYFLHFNSLVACVLY